MSLTKFEKITFLGAPWFFAMIMIICGLLVSVSKPQPLHGVILICSGLICMSIYCLCALLTRLLAEK